MGDSAKISIHCCVDYKINYISYCNKFTNILRTDHIPRAVFCYGPVTTQSFEPSRYVLLFGIVTTNNSSIESVSC